MTSLLPPYSPELNPIEQLWDQVAVGYANRVYETLDEIEEDITVVLRPFWENAQKILQLLGVDNYLLCSANASWTMNIIKPIRKWYQATFAGSTNQ